MTAGRKRALLTVAETAALLRIPEDDVLGMVADGELPAVAVDGDDMLIAEASLREFIGHAWVGDPWL